MGTDLINMSVGNALLVAVAGYLVDFLGIVLLMLVIVVMGRIFTSRAKAAAQAKAAAEAAAPAESAAVPAAPKAAPAPGSAGELKLYDTDPKDAAMIMAIVADHLGKPLNELRFKSIREVK